MEEGSGVYTYIYVCGCVLIRKIEQEREKTSGFDSFPFSGKLRAPPTQVDVWQAKAGRPDLAKAT